jgi:hypothetical protein
MMQALRDTEAGGAGHAHMKITVRRHASRTSTSGARWLAWFDIYVKNPRKKDKAGAIVRSVTWASVRLVWTHSGRGRVCSTVAFDRFVATELGSPFDRLVGRRRAFSERSRCLPSAAASWRVQIPRSASRSASHHPPISRAGARWSGGSRLRRLSAQAALGDAGRVAPTTGARRRRAGEPTA